MRDVALGCVLCIGYVCVYVCVYVCIYMCVCIFIIYVLGLYNLFSYIHFIISVYFLGGVLRVNLMKV